VTRATRVGILAALAVVTPGCATISVYSKIEPRAHTIGGAYTVEPRLAWSAVPGRRQDTWTIDGFRLESLRFFKGVAEGESLTGDGAPEARRPRFRTAMTPSELTEFVAESLYGSRYPPRRVRPAPFGGAPGFRFEVSYITRDGVEREGLVAGAVLQNQLHVIAYDGTALHHFARYREEVEAILATIRLR
jgi:hypothetical protein